MAVRRAFPNILTDRLKGLVENEILVRRPYAEHPGRTLYEYRLTEKGRNALG